MRRLDIADRTDITETFTTQPPVGFRFGTFASEMLVKPSMAETLVDIQAELNALKLTDEVSDEEMEEAGEWTLARYFEQ